jgi:hypothetical protein
MRVKRVTATFAVVLLGSATYAAGASACSSYSGPSGGQWGQASNWSPASVPTATDDVCINGSTRVVFAPYESGGQQVYSDAVKSITVGPQATLEIEGESSSYGGDYYQESDLTANNSVTVDSGGALLLDSTAINVAGGGVPAGATSGGQARLYVGSDPTPGQPTATLTNDGTITAETDPGTSFGEFIQGSIQNAGSLTDASGTLTLQDSNSLASSNSGAMTVAAGAATMLTGGPGFTNSGQITATGSLTLTSLPPQTWTESGGSVSGNTVSLYDGDTLAYSSGTGLFAFGSGSEQNSLSGTIPAGQTVTLDAGSTGDGNDGLSIDGTVTNDGTLIMDAPAGATGNPELDPGPSGGTFVNNGTINLLDPSASQSNLLRTDLTNDASGVIDVQSGTTYYDGGNTLLNQGTLLIAPAAHFIQKAGTATNSGTLSPQIASSTDFGTYDLYGGTFNAGGALSPVLVGGYVPAAGQEFDVLNIGNTDTYTGKFSTGGNGFTPDATHASPEPGYVGAVYAAASAHGVLHAAKVSSKGGKLSVKISCPAHDTCLAYTETATITEHLKGKKVIGLAAAKRKTKSKVITIARAKGTVAGGKTVTVKLTLNKSGAKLLKHYGKLRTVVTLTVAGKTMSRSTVTLVEPKPARKK